MTLFFQGINFCQLMKNGSGKRISVSSPIFRRGNKCEFISRPSITNGNSIPGSKSNIDGTSKNFSSTCYEKELSKENICFFTLPSLLEQYSRKLLMIWHVRGAIFWIWMFQHAEQKKFWKCTDFKFFKIQKKVKHKNQTLETKKSLKFKTSA